MVSSNHQCKNYYGAAHGKKSSAGEAKKNQPMLKLAVIPNRDNIMVLDFDVGPSL